MGIPHIVTFNEQFEALSQGLLAFHVLAGAPIIDGVDVLVGDTAFITRRNVTVKLAKGDALLELRLTYLDQSDAIRLCIADR